MTPRTGLLLGAAVAAVAILGRESPRRNPERRSRSRHNPTEGDVPNLDAADDKELLKWADETAKATAARFFGSMGPDETRVAQDLQRYMEKAVLARRLRRDGFVQAALTAETAMDRIYGSLPQWARW